jgi:hypothetical protein
MGNGKKHRGMLETDSYRDFLVFQMFVFAEIYGSLPQSFLGFRSFGR